MKKKVAIIHFSPLELYPPVMNLLDFLSKHETELNILVISTKPSETLSKFESPNIRIVRFSPIIASNFKFNKVWRYLVFYISSFLRIMLYKPKNIIYFETLSALPGIWYKRIKKRVKLFVHYHEIVTLDELKKGRTLNKYINNVEKKYYHKFRWISQTNKTRLEIFSKQYQLSFNSSVFNTLPNYPPSTWINQDPQQIKKKSTIKLVHIGALSLQGMYLKEVLDYFGSSHKYSIDFYSHKFSKEMEEVISKHDNCTIKGVIDYNNIPSLKGKYDVGLVLYNGSSLNFTYNAPNKIFEYLALDLDVWCSDKLITAKEYERLNCYPKMLIVDFENLENFDVDKALNRNDLKYVQSPYVCEPVYEKLLNALNEHTHS